MIKAGIVGATGYAGAELVRLLYAHPKAEIAAISSVSFEGQKLSDVYPSYKFLNDMVCENQDAVVEKSDVIFAALPHGSVSRARTSTPNGTAEPFLIKSSTSRAFTVCPSFSESRLRAKS